MPKTRKSLQVFNEAKAPNPGLYFPWRDPKKQYSYETIAIGFRRLCKLTVKNYATIPLVVTSILKLCWVDFFSVYKLKTNPDIVIPHGDQEPWHKFEHTHVKFNRVDMEPILREHPRPRFDYQMERRQLHFRWFPLSAQYYWPNDRQKEKESKGSNGSHDSNNTS